MSKAANGLNPKQQRFVDEYLKDLNGTQAAIRAGYSARTAQEQSSRLLSKAIVAAAVKAGIGRSVERAHLTVERIDQEISRLAFADLRKLYNPDGTLKQPHEWPDDVAAFVSGVEVVEKKAADGTIVAVMKKVKTWDKPAALTLAARRLALLHDKLAVEVTVEHKSELAGKILDAMQGRPVVIEGAATVIEAPKP